MALDLPAVVSRFHAARPALRAALRSALAAAALLLPGVARAADEARFDPPLEGVFLGLSGEARDGAFEVRRLEARSAADRAGLRVGDRILRLAESSQFPSYEDFTKAVSGLRRGEPVPLEVMRGGKREGLTLVPDPGVFRDYYRVLGFLRDSRFLRSREGFEEVLVAIQESTPEALRSASTSSQAFEALNEAVGRLGISHAAVVPPLAYRSLFAGEETGEGGYLAGLVIERVERPGRPAYFAAEVLDSSPAALAGLLGGDEVLRVNGVEVEASPRRSLAGYEAPRGRYTLLVERGETVMVEVRRRADGPVLTLSLSALWPCSGLEASRASQRSIEREGRLLGYLHFWNLLSPRLPALLEGPLGKGAGFAEALVLDLRGRGGSVEVLRKVESALRASSRPLVLLVDRQTRSAKEILVFALRGLPHVVVVGERTAGAVLPASYQDLPGGGRLMLPGDPRALGRLLRGSGLEGKGIEPDVAVAGAGHYSAGADPILLEGIRRAAEKLRGTPRRRRL